tara:strand:+ start:733 stop:1029 length:297 start_codon:yes stop_codon:yes gene_type:complete
MFRKNNLIKKSRSVKHLIFFLNINNVIDLIILSLKKIENTSLIQIVQNNWPFINGHIYLIKKNITKKFVVMSNDLIKPKRDIMEMLFAKKLIKFHNDN